MIRSMIRGRTALASTALSVALVLVVPIDLRAQVLPGNAQFLAESTAIAGAVENMDELQAAELGQAMERARALLIQAVTFDAGSAALSDASKELLNTKAWYLWFNPELTLTLSGNSDPGLGEDAARTQSRARVDAVRGYLQERGIELDRIGVEEAAPEAPTPASGGGVEFAVSGDPTNLDIPPPTASPPPAQSVPTTIEPSGKKRYNWGTVRIFYATDRNRTGDASVEKMYGGDRAPNGRLEFGRVDVWVPRVHRPGVVERPAWYTLWRSPDPDKHMIVQKIQPLGEAVTYDSLRRTLTASTSKEALVFIHGYNVSFHEAALRTAQLTYDLGFDGAPILYSWPSKGSVFHYTADRESAEWTARHLAGFLDSVTAITGAKRVHVLAHSMGNLALTNALDRMATPGRDTVFSNVVLAAPDVDVSQFEQQLAPAIRPLTHRLTVYMSGNDKALRASRSIWTHTRLGEATDPMVVVRGLDTIDASAVPTDLLGHGYVASSRQLIDDLILLINQHQGPPRGSLRPATAAGLAYWQLK